MNIEKRGHGSKTYAQAMRILLTNYNFPILHNM